MLLLMAVDSYLADLACCLWRFQELLFVSFCCCLVAVAIRIVVIRVLVYMDFIIGVMLFIVVVYL